MSQSLGVQGRRPPRGFCAGCPRRGLHGLPEGGAWLCAWLHLWAESGELCFFFGSGLQVHEGENAQDKAKRKALESIAVFGGRQELAVLDNLHEECVPGSASIAQVPLAET